MNSRLHKTLLVGMLTPVIAAAIIYLYENGLQGAAVYAAFLCTACALMFIISEDSDV